MLKFFLIVFLCSSSTTTGVAQSQGYEYTDSSLLDTGNKTESNGVPGNQDNTETNVTDTILYTHVIDIFPDTINSWKNDKKYSYVKNLDSLLRMKENEYASPEKSVRNSSAPSFFLKLLSSSLLKMLFWGAAIFFILFILYKLFLSQGIFKKNRSSLLVNELQEDEKEIDDPSDYDALIHQSFKLDDFRMAVRYLFLKTLRQLSDKGQVLRSVDKTNFQYVQEIAADKRKDFASLVLNYEYVWYGHLNISREQYSQMEKNFSNFYKKI